ncbi:OLC1v1024511C1 [Oldenlandia corymbosa var. corymbosa]|uniref:OLC1v1024511C1 n=1 Tax=Oldenlandia corymbosa var. corymbosa TaxID=529605 RepID=A0AAV1C4Z3_OLDCO|nr:OLC1v1024511C1 [Oldenlandia corymbosa var. corymbosa]
MDELKIFVDACLANEEWKKVLYDVIAHHGEFVHMRQLVTIRKFEEQSAALDFEHVIPSDLAFICNPVTKSLSRDSNK